MHPHAGIATITYVLSGTNRHLDSYGHDAMMNQGDLSWMVAGKGIQHAEGAHSLDQPPESSHGIQFWISLPADLKFVEPKFFHFEANELPTRTSNGVEVSVLAGSLDGDSSPAESLSPAYIYELKLGQRSEIRLPIEEGNTCAAYVIAGEIQAQNHTIPRHSAAEFARDGDHVVLESPEGGHVVVFGGKPLDEPIVSYASFVMNSQEQIQQVLTSYRDGEMQK